MIEKEYRSLMLRVGLAMLANISLLYLQSSLVYLLYSLLLGRLDGSALYISLELFSALLYASAFLLPAGLFYLLSRGKRPLPPLLEPRLGKDFPLMLLSVIALSLAAGYLNAYMINIVNYYDYYGSAAGGIDGNLPLLLAFVSSVIVPAFCEEMLFRGVILTNLQPYGKTTALIVSASLFALMHNNGAQLFYTFIAGILIGWVYIRTRSLWGCILIHFFNNLLAVLTSRLYSHFGDNAYKLTLPIELAVFALGAASLIILLIREGKRKRGFTSSGFGVLLPRDEDYTAKALGRGEAVRGFFSPTVIIFVCLAAFNIFSAILRAALNLR